MWIKASEIQKGDKVFTLGEVKSVNLANGRVSIVANNRNVSCNADSSFWVESLYFQPTQ